MQGFITYKLELWPDLIIQVQDIRNILSQDKYSKSGHFNFGLTIEFRIRDFMLNGATFSLFYLGSFVFFLERYHQIYLYVFE